MENGDVTSSSKFKSKRRIRILRRIIFSITIFLILFVSGTFLLSKSLNFDNQRIVKFNEKSNLDYKVYLFKNEFYEQKYLDKDMVYVANLIDKITLDFNYVFSSDDYETIDFDYSIVAKLSITNTTSKKSYFDKTYTLLNNRSVKLVDGKSQEIDEHISIDYPFYNSLANNFKNQYGVIADNILTVYMIINKKSAVNSDYNVNSDSIMNIQIPLTERSIDIRLDYKDINETRSILKEEKISIKNFVPLIIASILIIISLIMIVMAIRNIKLLFSKKSAFDKYVNKILKEYDRLIAESNTLLSFGDKEVININKFTELLDIHDNLQLPIMYYCVTDHKLCYFYINHGNIMYIHKVEAKADNKK